MKKFVIMICEVKIYVIICLLSTLITGISCSSSNLTAPLPDDNKEIDLQLLPEIVFVSYPEEILYIRRSDMNVTKLTRDTFVFDANPSWSPDGKQIVFTRRDLRSLADPPSPQIFIINRDGTGLQQLDKGFWGDWPRFSPDGSKILFLSRRSGDESITLYIMNRDGSNQELLSEEINSVTSPPSWSPDGSQIVVSMNNQLYTLNEDGTNVKALFPQEQNIRSINPSWSPDGNKILFETPHSNPFGGSMIRTAKPNGTEITNILQTRNTSGQSTAYPTFSPDGSKILFVSQCHESERLHIFVMKSDGTEITDLEVKLDSDQFTPVWSPKGPVILK